jgi:GT2 family glycosyltransferase
VSAEPLVTVIMPAYNQARYLPAALDSVLGQTFRDFEIVVVDDGSTDETPQILARYGVRCIRQENAGLPAARNTAIAAARGRWLAFLDSDDVWQPAYLATTMAALERVPEAVGAFAAWLYIDGDGRPLDQAVRPFGGDERRLVAELDWRNALLPSAAVVSRAAVVACGAFDTGLAACEDWDLWLRLRAHGRLLLVPEVLMLYRSHGESMTDDPLRIERERLKVNAKHHGPLEGPPAGWPEKRRRAAGFTYFTTALAYLRQGEMAAALGRLEQGLACWPGLAGQDEFFYELGCAYQPRGRRGYHLDLAQSEALLQTLIFDRLPLPPTGRALYWGHACLILARLARRNGQRPAGRRYALQALRHGRPAHKAAALRALARSFLTG